MSVVAAAVVTSAVVGSKSADKAQDRADARQASSDALAEDRLAFDREQFDEQNRRYNRDYNRFMRIYGDVEDNLGKFYDQLTPEFLEAAGLQENKQEFARAREQIKTSISQRNLDGSGLVASELSKTHIAEAEANAEVRRDAPLKVAEMKQGFVNRAPASPAAPSGDRLSASMGHVQQLAQQGADRQQATADSMYNSAGQMLSAGLMYAGQQHYTPSSASGGTLVTDYNASFPNLPGTIDPALA